MREIAELTQEQEDIIYSFCIGCEAWMYLERLVFEFSCDPKAAANWMINRLFPALKKMPELKCRGGYSLAKSPVPIEALAGFIKSGDRRGFKACF